MYLITWITTHLPTYGPQYRRGSPGMSWLDNIAALTQSAFEKKTLRIQRREISGNGQCIMRSTLGWFRISPISRGDQCDMAAKIANTAPVLNTQWKWATMRNKMCAWRHNMSPPPNKSKSTISSHLFARWRCCSGITTSSYLFVSWHLFGHVGYLGHQQQVDFWPSYLESGVRVTCDVGYLCADFSLPRPHCSGVRSDVNK